MAIAKDYAAHGASAISVLTEERFFQGRLGVSRTDSDAGHGAAVAQRFHDRSVPDRRGEELWRRRGAVHRGDARCQLMGELRQQAAELQMDSLVEVHSESELKAALDAGAQLIGINNRDLNTFAVSLATTERLAPLIPAGVPAICESGIDSIEQIHRVESLGVHAFLIGETLMRAPSPGVKLGEY